MGWNPANWAITNTLQGQQGGWTVNNSWAAPLLGTYKTPIRTSGGTVPGATIVRGATQTQPYSTTQQNTGGNEGGTDNTSTTDSSSVYGSGGSGGLSGADYAALQSQIDATQGGLNRLGTQKKVAIQNINDGYQSSLQDLKDGFAVAQRDYNKSVSDSNEGYQKSISNIDVQTGQGLQSLRRLLGRFGAGASSASRVLAPYAAGLQGARNRNEVTDQFNDNANNLATDWKDYSDAYDKEDKRLLAVRDQQTDKAEAEYLTRKAGFLEALAGLNAQLSGSYAAAQPYITQANSLLDKAVEYDRLFKDPIQAKDVTLEQTELNPYEWSATAAPIIGENVAMGEAINPYAQLFRRRDEESKLANQLNY